MSALAILLVHIGTPPPKILESNFKWLKSKHPGIRLLLASDQPKERFPYATELEFVNLNSVGQSWKSIDSTPHSRNFRGGYWLHTARRLGAIADVHNQFPQFSLLHIENDMLLLDDFPFVNFSSLKKIAWLRCCKESDMPGLIYSPNKETSKWLLRNVVASFREHPQFTDMLVLRDIAVRNPLDVDYLFGGSLSSSDEITWTDDDLTWILDPLPFGAYLVGSDPRNDWGFSRRLRDYPPSALGRPSEFRFTHSPDRGLLAEHLELGKKYRIANLHVHSKDLQLFDVDAHEHYLGKLVRFSQMGFPSIVFYFAGWLGALTQLIEAVRAKLLRF